MQPGSELTPGHLVNLPVLNLIETQRFIDLVYSPRVTGALHVSHAGDFTGRQFARSDVSQLLNYVQQCDQAGSHSVYLRATTSRTGLRPGRRGMAGDAVELPGLWADLDFGTAGHAERNELPRPPDEATAAHVVTLAGFPAPTLWVHSGGGLYPWWLLHEPFLISPETQAYLTTLSRKWQAVLAAAARSQGWFYGTEASDLARVLRLPGTVNRKVAGRARPCHLVATNGPRYLLQDLHQAVEAACQHWGVNVSAALSQPRASTSETKAFFAALVDPDGPPCRFMQTVQDRWTSDIRAAGASCHNEGVKASLAIAMEATKQHHGAFTAMQAVKEVWLGIRQPGASTGRAIESADTEWDRLEHGAWSKAAAQANRARDDKFFTDSDKCRCFNGPFVAASENTDDVNFWSARPQLKHVYDFAISRRASPWATLGVVLTRVIGAVPPHVVLPPLIGGVVSTNIFLALVGKSGRGKGAAMRAAKEAVVLGARGVFDGEEHYFDEHKLGTGQAIAHAYAYRDKEGVQRYADSALFLLDEVDHLSSHAAQTGSTVLAELKCLYMGEKLGSLYVDPMKRIEIAEQSYRAGFIVGVQPEKAQVIFNDTDGGTPQRFVWLPTVYAQPRQRPEGPEPLTWTPPVWEPWIRNRQPQEAGLPWAAGTPATGAKQIIVDVAATACDAIDEANWRQSIGEGDPLDGHRLLCQEKVAFAFGVLDGRVEISEEDWQLAGHLMALSDATRGGVLDVLAREVAKKNTARGHAEASRAVLVDNAREEAAIKRVAQHVLRLLDRHDGWVRHSELRREIRSTDRVRFDEALVSLVHGGQVEAEKINYQGQDGLQYRRS